MQMKKSHRFAGVPVLGSDKEKTRWKAYLEPTLPRDSGGYSHGSDPSTRASHEENIHACRLLECEPHHAGKDEPFVGRVCERLERKLHEIQQLAAQGLKEVIM